MDNVVIESKVVLSNNNWWYIVILNKIIDETWICKNYVIKGIRGENEI